MPDLCTPYAPLVTACRCCNKAPRKTLRSEETTRFSLGIRNGYTTLVTSHKRKEANVMPDEEHFFRYRASSMTSRIVPTYYRILANIESDERLSGVYRR